MIQNVKELRIIQSWVEIFKKAIQEKEDMRGFWETDTNIHPMLHQAELDGMTAKLKELEQEVSEYEAS